MEVTALVPGKEHVCTRYRLTQFKPHFEKNGIKLNLEPLAGGIRERIAQLTRPRKNSVVILLRKLLPIWQLGLLRQSSRVLIYDFDDAVFFRDSFHIRGPYSVTRAMRFAATIRLADRVIAGNCYLADAACKHTRPDRIDVIPTAIDVARYPMARHDDRRPTRLVWIGSSSTLKGLERGKSILESIGREIPQTVLRIICNRFLKLRHLRVETTQWSPDTETCALGESDIGFSWIPDDAWSQGKCGLKVLQYMAAGLPVVASPVGVHPNLIGNEAGFLPKDPGEWIETVRRLSVDSELRNEMGTLARARIEKDYHVDVWGPVLAGRLREAAIAL